MEGVIALDYTAAASHWPGVGRYGRELVRALVQLEDCPRLLLFECGRPGSLPAAALGIEAALASGRVRRIVIPGRERWRQLRARALGRGIEGQLARASGGHLLGVHRAFPARPPVRGVPEVQPLFELPAAAPDMRALATVDHIVVGSQAGRDQACAHLGLPPSRISAVRTGADHWLRDAAPLAELPPAAPRQIVALGATSAARAPLELLAAFERVHARTPTVRLHFDGRPGDVAAQLTDHMERSPARAAITWQRDPIEADLPALVANAAVLVHLSRNELSPVTPLEALHFGTAVVASKLPAFAEALPADCLFDSTHIEQPEPLASALEAALASAAEPAARAARRAHAAPFTWSACARDHIALWRAHFPK